MTRLSTLIVLLCLLCGCEIHSMPSVIASPSTMASLAKGTGAWSDSDNAKLSDDAYAQATVSTVNSTEWLVATNFGLSLPDGSVVTGIIASIELKSATPGSSHLFGNAVLVIGGVPDISTDQANGETFEDTESTITFGSSTNKWETDLTKALVEASDLGIAVAFPVTGAPARIIRVDHMQIELFYETAGGLCTSQIIRPALRSTVKIQPALCVGDLIAPALRTTTKIMPALCTYAEIVPSLRVDVKVVN